MKIFWLAAAFCFGLLTYAPSVHAFSTEQSPATNADGTPKFADPDEQMPRFMVAPGNTANANGTLSFGAPSVTAPTMGETDSGAQAFDQAYAHQQVKQ